MAATRVHKKALFDDIAQLLAGDLLDPPAGSVEAARERLQLLTQLQHFLHADAAASATDCGATTALGSPTAASSGAPTESSLSVTAGFPMLPLKRARQRSAASCCTAASATQVWLTCSLRTSTLHEDGRPKVRACVGC